MTLEADAERGALRTKLEKLELAISAVIGSGFVIGAAMTTVLVLAVLVVLSRWERRFSKEATRDQQGGEHGTAAIS